MVALLLFLTAFDAYVGYYELVPSESADMSRVVDDAASQLNFLIRPIARSRLRKTQIAFPAVTIDRSDTGLRIAHAQGTDITHRAVDHAVATQAPDGSKIVARLLAGPPLAQTYESGEGMRVNRYVLDGAKLRVEVRITSPRLPKPIEYVLVYRKK